MNKILLTLTIALIALSANAQSKFLQKLKMINGDSMALNMTEVRYAVRLTDGTATLFYGNPTFPYATQSTFASIVSTSCGNLVQFTQYIGSSTQVVAINPKWVARAIAVPGVARTNLFMHGSGDLRVVSGTYQTVSGLLSNCGGGGGGGADNWGSQFVRTDATLSGQGTLASVLKIAQQGAASGEVLKWNGSTWLPASDDGGGAVTDGDYGDITVTGGGTAWNIDNNTIGSAEIINSSVTLADLQNIATNRVLGRTTAGTGVIELLAPGAGIAFTGGEIVNTAGGTVTSVALTAPSAVFDVAGSPITTSGTFAITFDNQAINTVFAGPGSGGAGQPAFRALVAADIPTLTSANISDFTEASQDATNSLLIAGVQLTGTYNDVANTYTLDWDGAVIDATLDGNGITGTPLKIAQQGATNNQVLKWNGTTWVPANDDSGSGSVTSVGLAAPTSVFDVTNSPVTSSGTLTLTFDNQAANTAFMGPVSGGAATPAFRALVVADIPALTSANISDFTEAAQDAAAAMITGGDQITTTYTDVSNNFDIDWDGAIVTARLTGTGLTGAGLDIAQQGATSGQNLEWNGTSWAPATDDNSGGTVTSVALTAPAAVFDVAGSPITGSGTFAITFDDQNANLVFAGPASGGAAQPAFRALVAADIASITNNIYTTNGTLTSNRTLTGSNFFLVHQGLSLYGEVSSGDNTTVTTGAGSIVETSQQSILETAVDDIILDAGVDIDMTAGGGVNVFPVTRLHVDNSAAATTSIQRWENTAADIDLFVVTTPPEGVVTGSPGDISIGPAGTAGSGAMYLKITGSATNTGWTQVDTDVSDDVAGNIYTVDGTLAGARILTGGGNPLTFTGLAAYSESGSGNNTTTTTGTADILENSAGDITMTAGVNASILAAGDVFIESTVGSTSITSGDILTIDAASDLSIISASQVYVEAGTVYNLLADDAINLSSNGSIAILFQGAADDFTVQDNTTTKQGIEYFADYNATILPNPRSIPDVGGVNTLIGDSIPDGLQNQTLRYNGTPKLEANYEITNNGTNVAIGGNFLMSGYELAVTGAIKGTSKVMFGTSITPTDTGGSFVQSDSLAGYSENFFENKNAGSAAGLDLVLKNRGSTEDTRLHWQADFGETGVMWSAGLDKSDDNKFKFSANYGTRDLTDYTIYTIHSDFESFALVGIGVTSPTATLHLKAGSAVTQTAPLKFNVGPPMTTPEDGAVEYIDTGVDNLAFTVGSSRYILHKGLTEAFTIDFASTNAGLQSFADVTLTGAAAGDRVIVAEPAASAIDGVRYFGVVTAANTVRIGLYNFSAGTVNPGSLSYNVTVIH